MIVLVLFLFLSFSYQLQVVDLKVKKQGSGEFIRFGDNEKVYFSWKIELDGSEKTSRNIVQDAYQVDITSYGQSVFSSGKVSSNRTTYIHFEDFDVKNSQLYSWNVKVWSNLSPQTPISSKDDGKFYSDISASEWEKTKWVAGGNLYRNEFLLSKDAISDATDAFLFISGLGYHIPFLNGDQVSSEDRFLDPSWTNYNDTVLYSAYEVSSMLKEGKNVLAVMAGNGWFVGGAYYGRDSEKCVRSVLQVRKSDGSFTSFYSLPTSWNVTKEGPITSDSVYNGEHYDARKYESGWNDINFVLTEHWTLAEEPKQPPAGSMKLQQRPPILVSEEFSPVHEFETERATYIFDFGQNFAGVCRFEVSGCVAGSQIVMRHAEILTTDGKALYTDNLRGAEATDSYTCSEDEQQSYRPAFTVHGFRYMEVVGVSAEMKKSFKVTGYHFHTSVPVSGKIQFEDVELYNKLQSNIKYGQQSNLMSVPTDCPQRDERLGWLADSLLSSQEAMFNFDMNSFYERYLESFPESFGYNNSLGDIVPFVNRFWDKYQPGDPSWTAAYPFIVYGAYKQYGDIYFVKNQYPSLKLYMEFMESKFREVEMKKIFCYYGDWCPPKPYDHKHICELSGSFYFLVNLQQMMDLATAIGEHGDATKYQDLLRTYSGQFRSNFLTDHGKKIGDDSQTACVLSLALGDVFTEKDREEITSILTKDVEESSYHVRTGIIGTFYLFPMLSEVGKHDYALSISQRTSFPSYGYMIYNDIEPATTLWELWNSPTGSPGMDSRNHIMYGSIGGYFYQSLAGIGNDEGSFGYDTVRIAPKIFPKMQPNKVQASYESIRGRVSVDLTTKTNSFCRIVDEQDSLSVSCPFSGDTITSISFASFGRPRGSCGSGFAVNKECHAGDSLEVLRNECLGKGECSIELKSDRFKEFRCWWPLEHGTYQLFLTGSCGSDPDLFKNELRVEVPVNVKSHVLLDLYQDKSQVWVREGETLIFDKGEVKSNTTWVEGNVLHVRSGSGVYNYVVSNEKEY